MSFCRSLYENLVENTLADLKSPKFWRGVVAELLGTLLLVLIGCGSCHSTKNWEAADAPDTVQIALTFGLAVATIVWGIAHISGGHINPAVTWGLFVARKISLIKTIIFIVVQCCGAILGALVLTALSPKTDSLGATTLWMNETAGERGTIIMTPAMGFGVEACITFVLVFTVFASIDGNRTDLSGSGPLAIGLSVTVCHFFAIKYTGSSMNPARTFGPAVVVPQWKDHWVYWIGPLTGATVAALSYSFAFAENASKKKVSKYFSQRRYQETEPLHEVVAADNPRGQKIYHVEGGSGDGSKI